MTDLLTLITPTNLLDEKEKFFASKTYNPIFSYLWEVEPLTPATSDPGRLALWEAVKNQDHILITSRAQELFEVSFDESTLHISKEHAKAKGSSSSRGSAQEYAHLTREGLDYFGLHDVKVVLTDQAGFNARPQHKEKIILVSKHIQFEFFSMEGGVHHELVHSLRYYNGIYNSIKRSKHYLPTEEGLASWCQDHANDDNGLAQHAMEYLASSVGLNGSLRDVYEVFCNCGASAELAWKRASRHKFGFIDTSLPGDIIKPAMYYYNELKVDKLSTDERLKLFIGKISIGELNQESQYHGIWEAENLIDYFHL